MTNRRFLFLLSSARSGGNTESMARAAAAALPPDATQDWCDLTKAALPAFEDLRHGASYGPLSAPMADLAERTMQASDLVFVAPLYWYGLPAPAKLYLDHWSHWMRLPDLGFKSRMAGKRAWLIMAHAGSSEAEIAPAREGLRLAAAYLSIGWGGALLADANAPGDWQKDPKGQSAAAQFFAA
jgi:NAD(P)H-dependent FMN reductase